MSTIRQEMIELLEGNPMTVRQLSKHFRLPLQDVVDHLEHVFRSLPRTEHREIVHVAECRKCGFQFSADKLVKPGKCPKCRATFISEPMIETNRRTGNS